MSHQNQLIAAVRSGNIETVKKLASKLDLNKSWSLYLDGSSSKIIIGEHLLELAVEKGNAEILTIICDNISDIGAFSFPLLEAAIKGKADLASILLKNNAWVNFENKVEETALSCALTSKNSDTIRLLVTNQKLVIPKQLMTSNNCTLMLTSCMVDVEEGDALKTLSAIGEGRLKQLLKKSKPLPEYKKLLDQVAKNIMELKSEAFDPNSKKGLAGLIKRKTKVSTPKIVSGFDIGAVVLLIFVLPVGLAALFIQAMIRGCKKESSVPKSIGRLMFGKIAEPKEENTNENAP